jgi:hypothetical protein
MIENNKIIQKAMGDSETASQYTFENAIIAPLYPLIPAYEYSIPTFNPSGASFDYYGQNIHAISTNLNNKKIVRFNWLSGTESLSGTNLWRQEIYRIPFQDYDAFVNATGETQANLLNTISNYLTNPLITLDITASTITVSTYYDYEVPTVVKPTDSFAEQLFLDKAQYFIDSKLVFNRQIDNTIGDFIYPTHFDGTAIEPPIDITNQYVSLDDGGLVQGITASTLGQFQEIISDGKPYIIASGITSNIKGQTVNGAYFVYFVVPKKPNIDVLNGGPSVFGMLDTFSPIFNFNTVDDGDYYRLQVSYDITDYSFTGSQRALFFIDKQPGDPEFVRSYSTPLSPAEDFIYRIGNTKEIINIFGVKQNVTTWGRIESANTANDGTFNVSGYVYQTYFSEFDPVNPSLGGIPVISGATISFLVISNTSAIDLGADVPTVSSILGEVTQGLAGGVGSIFTAVTDLNGYYSVPNVPGGYINVTVTSPPSFLNNPIFSSTSQTVNIFQDVGKNFNLTIYWGFTGLTFQEFENYPFI